MSVYVKIIALCDKSNIAFWVDNCSGQNKNYYLFSTLVHIVNSKEEQFRNSSDTPYGSLMSFRLVGIGNYRIVKMDHFVLPFFLVNVSRLGMSVLCKNPIVVHVLLDFRALRRPVLSIRLHLQLANWFNILILFLQKCENCYIFQSGLRRHMNQHHQAGQSSRTNLSSRWSNPSSRW